MALIPDEDAATIVQENQALKRYVESATDLPVELVVTTDYSALITAAAADKVDLAYFGPLSYVIASSKADIEPFAARLKNGSTTYEAVLIGNREQGIDRFEKVRGQAVAFGDPASTASRLFPQLRLSTAGLQPDVDYTPVFLGAHDAVAKAVESGNAAAGGLSRPIYDKLVKQGKINPDKLVVLGASASIPQYPWTIRAALPEDLKEKVRLAFYSVTDPEILEPFGADGFAPVTDADYDIVRQAAQVLDLQADTGTSSQ